MEIEDIIKVETPLEREDTQSNILGNNIELLNIINTGSADDTTIERLEEITNTDVGKGLTTGQVAKNKKKFGSNEEKRTNSYINIRQSKSNKLKQVLNHIISGIGETTIKSIVLTTLAILLLISESIEKSKELWWVEGSLLLLFVLFHVVFYIVQNVRYAILASTRNSTKVFKKHYNAIKYKVIREGKVVSLTRNELVVGDILLIHPGLRIPNPCILVTNCRIYTTDRIRCEFKHVFYEHCGILEGHGYAMILQTCVESLVPSHQHNMIRLLRQSQNKLHFFNVWLTMEEETVRHRLQKRFINFFKITNISNILIVFIYLIILIVQHSLVTLERTSMTLMRQWCQYFIIGFLFWQTMTFDLASFHNSGRKKLKLFLSNSGIIAAFNQLERWSDINDVIIADHHLLSNPSIVSKLTEQPKHASFYHHIIVALAGKGAMINHEDQIVVDSPHRTLLLNEMAKEQNLRKEMFQVIQSQLEVEEPFDIIERQESFIESSQIKFEKSDDDSMLDEDDEEEITSYNMFDDEMLESICYNYKGCTYDVIEGCFSDVIKECNSFFDAETGECKLLNDEDFIKKSKLFHELSAKGYYCNAIAYRYHMNTCTTLYILVGVYVIHFKMDEKLVDQIKYIQNRGMNVRLLSQFGQDFTTKIAEHVGISEDESSAIISNNQFMKSDDADVWNTTAIYNWNYLLKPFPFLSEKYFALGTNTRDIQSLDNSGVGILFGKDQNLVMYDHSDAIFINPDLSYLAHIKDQIRYHTHEVLSQMVHFKFVANISLMIFMLFQLCIQFINVDWNYLHLSPISIIQLGWLYLIHHLIAPMSFMAGDPYHELKRIPKKSEYATSIFFTTFNLVGMTILYSSVQLFTEQESFLITHTIAYFITTLGYISIITATSFYNSPYSRTDKRFKIRQSFILFIVPILGISTVVSCIIIATGYVPIFANVVKSGQFAYLDWILSPICMITLLVRMPF